MFTHRLGLRALAPFVTSLALSILAVGCSAAPPETEEGDVESTEAALSGTDQFVWRNGQYPSFVGGQFSLISTNHSYRAIFQGDGNFVVYHGTPTSIGHAIWASNTAGPLGRTYYLNFSPGGYIQTGRWSDNRSDADPWAKLEMQNDGNLVVYTSPSSTFSEQVKALWSTGTNGK